MLYPRLAHLLLLELPLFTVSIPFLLFIPFSADPLHSLPSAFRLQDHQARRAQLRNALTLVTSKASSLLAGTGSAAGSFGVKDERELKAEKWLLASRAFAAREGVAKGKEANSALEQDLSVRRAALASRRANLSTARSLLSSLSPPSPSPSTSSASAVPPSSLALPTSLPSLRAHLSSLHSSLTALSLESARIRRILATELLAVFALAPVEPVLADPFSPIPQHSSPAPSPSSEYSPRRSSPSTSPAAPHYTLHTLPLPPLSLFPTLPPETLEALLSHLLHLTRLVAMYERVAVPFAVLPGCFGPGRGGIRAVGGLLNVGREESAGADGGQEGDVQEGKRKGRGKATSRVGVDCWPLFFGTHPSSSSGGKSRRKAGAGLGGNGGASSATSSTAASLIGGNPALSTAGDGASEAMALDYPSEEDDDDEELAEEDVLNRSTKSSSSSSSRTQKGKKLSSNPSKSLAKRYRAVFTGAVCIAYDLAYIAWVREERRRQGMGRKSGWRMEDLEDLGRLIRRAAGVENDDTEGAGGEGAERVGEKAKEEPTDSISSPFIDDPSSPSPSSITSSTQPSSTLLPLDFNPSSSSSSFDPNPLSFPLSFSALVEYYSALAFPESEGESTVLLATPTGRRSTSRRTREGGGAGDEEDEEWDFV
ncbi:hypothetical protein JCM11251_004553 [Rhodosporidiobolus azoricus]